MVLMLSRAENLSHRCKSVDPSWQTFGRNIDGLKKRKKKRETEKIGIYPIVVNLSIPAGILSAKIKEYMLQKSRKIYPTVVNLSIPAGILSAKILTA